MIKFWLKKQFWYRPIHLKYVAYRAKYIGLPNWRPFYNRGDFSHLINKKGESLNRILIATATGGHLPSMTLESLLGVTLNIRGGKVDFLLCDGALPACMMCEINWYTDVAAFGAKGPSDRCRACHQPSAQMLENAALPVVGLGSQITQEETSKAKQLAEKVSFQDIASFTDDSISIGEHAWAGALRFFARGDVETEPQAEVVLRRYFEAALLTYYACRRLLAGGRYSVVVLNHGIYVPQGVIAETAKRLGVRVVTWHPAYRRGCFIFNHGETYHHGLMNEPVSSWEDMPWDKSQQKKIEQYLKSRWIGKNDWVKFHREPELDIVSIKREIGIDFSRPTVGLLTNVVWDAQLHYKANAFTGMLEWLTKTIAYFEKRPDLQLLIRVHPAELTGTLPSRQPAVAEIQRAFPFLPSNVFIIPPESRISTYVAMSQCNAVLIYGTKTSVELAASGIPVIVAGEAWIRGKGISIDTKSGSDYFLVLDKLPLPSRMNKEDCDRALKYAFHFFFRRMIPLEGIKEKKGWPPFQVAIHDLDELMPGRSKGLDVICQGILEGTPFIYPAELEVGDEKQDTKKDGVPFCASA